MAYNSDRHEILEQRVGIVDNDCLYHVTFAVATAQCAASGENLRVLRVYKRGCNLK
jgi:hypothetical protein